MSLKKAYVEQAREGEDKGTYLFQDLYHLVVGPQYLSLSPGCCQLSLSQAPQMGPVKKCKDLSLIIHLYTFSLAISLFSSVSGLSSSFFSVSSPPVFGVT